MTRNRWLLVLTVVIGGFLLLLRAQDGAAEIGQGTSGNAGKTAPNVAEGDAPKPGSSLEVALLRPYRFPFGRPTPLFEVCAHLKQTLKAEVVLDLAALGRQDVEPDDLVQLDLEGVRLKTGLKLLLDQVGLTYRVVAEDNLMIITDIEGTDDPMARVLSELQALHRDLHALQDDVDELRDFVGDDRQGGRVRKPTIIEELPEAEGQGRNPAGGPEKPGNTRQKPGPDAGASGARPAPSRVPLHGPRRGVIKPKAIVAPIGRA
jgi:hypothetical protein